MDVVEPLPDEFPSETKYSPDNETDPIDNQEIDAHEVDDDDDDGDSQSGNDDNALIELTHAEDKSDAKVSPRKRQKCTECEMVYSKRKYLQKHMLREHNVDLPKAKRGRTAHILMPTDDNPRPYKCDQCIKEYTLLRHLTRHKRMHARTFCDLCQKSFACYDEHMRKEHNVELPRPFECDICGRSFRVKSTFQAHMRIHREENRVFNCTLCSKSFFQATDLRKHIKSHSNIRSVICDVCGDAFKSAETLKCHMRRHNGDRPYPCKLCPRAFTTSNSLMIHQRTHTNEKPYECEVCQKRFSDWSTLLVHKRLHSGESPYCCHLCGRRTKQASNLRSHYKHLHKINDISGRQVRMNAKIFERFTQPEIDQHLHDNGDLIGLLAKGLNDYNNEQNEKTEMTEKMIETMRAPLRPAKKEMQCEKASDKESDVSFRNSCKMMSEHDVGARSGVAEAIQMPIKQEEPLDAYDLYADKNCTENANEMENIAMSAVSASSSDHIESVFIIEELGPSVEYGMADEFKMECDEDPANHWIDGGSFDETNAPHDIVKCEYSIDSKPNRQKVKKSTKSKKTKTIEMQMEMQTKKARILLSCSVCKKRVHGDNLNVHIVECHSALERPFECFLCHKQFKQFRHVSYHLRTHYRDERNFVCHICGDAYIVNADLNKHIFNRHSDVRPFKCERCDKHFKSRNALKVHMRSHTGIKEFQCSICSERFSANSSLRLHFRRHTNEKPYECTYCGKRFSDGSTHRQHERIHTGEKPYVCHLCGRRTTQAGNLKSHYRHYHKLEVKSVKMENSVR